MKVGTRVNRKAAEHYETIPTADICKLDIGKICKENSICMIWTPFAKINEALRVMDAWGFVYLNKMTWIKTNSDGSPRMGIGNIVRNCAEDILIGRRGHVRNPEPANRFLSVFFADQSDHSRKPPESYDIIQSMFPTLTKIEIFARWVYPGWTGVGNEAEIEPHEYKRRNGMDTTVYEVDE